MVFHEVLPTHAAVQQVLSCFEHGPELVLHETIVMCIYIYKSHMSFKIRTNASHTHTHVCVCARAPASANMRANLRRRPHCTVVERETSAVLSYNEFAHTMHGLLSWQLFTVPSREMCLGDRTYNECRRSSLLLLNRTNYTICQLLPSVPQECELVNRLL